MCAWCWVLQSIASPTKTAASIAPLEELTIEDKPKSTGLGLQIPPTINSDLMGPLVSLFPALQAFTYHKQRGDTESELAAAIAEANEGRNQFIHFKFLTAQIHHNRPWNPIKEKRWEH